MKKILLTMCALMFIMTSFAQTEKTLKRKVASGRFTNETQYAKGMFYERENDPMRKQALDILSSKLAASGKFILLERDGLEELIAEGKDIEMNCHFCNENYNFSVEELKQILKKAKN